MSTKTRSVHDRHCDRCDKRIAADRPRFILGPTGLVALAPDAPSSPNAMDLDRACERSLLGWWNRPTKDEAAE